MADPATPAEATGLEVAIIGLAGRFPAAPSVEALWHKVSHGLECITRLSDDELLASGVDPAVFGASNYVRARGVVEDAECFDAAFFGYFPREAELMDPQHRLFLECAWHALEDAGYAPQGCDAPTGVYAGSGRSAYLTNNLRPDEALMASASMQVEIGSGSDFLATRVAYKLNLSGPAVCVQTACSTSLVAVHLACQGLLASECDMALAGGSSVGVPSKIGYVYEEDGVLSPDGHCRTFDTRAQGTMRGDGVGIVVLKRLADALEDGDTIRAVIKGSAINNDGSGKVGFTAPSVGGQAGCIRRALAMAEVDPDTIGLIEAHGTATPLGDPIEVAALTEVFRARTTRRGYCALGSVKTNTGHLDAAAGVIGLIKAALALEHRKLPPSLHFEEPNPKLELPSSPFYVPTELRDWERADTPRRAGVSSFGIGGTNAHAVLEEAPAPAPSSPGRRWQVLALSARTPKALEASTQRLLAHLKAHPSLALADVAYTLQVGRTPLAHRRMLVCRDVAEAVELLEAQDPRRVLTGTRVPERASVAFLFPGQGAQYVGMGAELYESEPVFRSVVDDCCDKLRPLLGLDLRHLLYPENAEPGEREAHQLKQTAIAQPALFVVEVALARLFLSWGIAPEAMLGHSIGEYASAHLAGVVSLESALALVTARGRLMQRQPAGAMLAVPLPEAAVRARLGPELSLAAVNTPTLCVVSGPGAAVDAFEAALQQEGTLTTRLHTSHAFHSAMMDPILAPFEERVREVSLSRPHIPCLSNVSGRWLTEGEATDPAYWARHIRQPVAFSKGIEELCAKPGRTLLEVGPGRTLVTLASQHGNAGVRVQAMRHPGEHGSDVAMAMEAVGRLWLSGVEVDWAALHEGERRRRLPLPGYPFERERYWIEPSPRSGRSAGIAAAGRRPLADWFYTPTWHRTPPPPRRASECEAEGKEDGPWLVFADECGVGDALVAHLAEDGHRAVSVSAGASFAQRGDHAYTIDPTARGEYDQLFQSLAARDVRPDRIVHLFGVTPSEEYGAASLDRALGVGFYSLLYTAQALSSHPTGAPVRLTVVTTGAQDVTGDEPLCAHKAMALGPCKVIPQELPGIRCHSVDLAVAGSDGASSWQRRSAEQLMRECEGDGAEPAVAYRGRYRWVQRFTPSRLGAAAQPAARLREQGVYLITGGLGHIGLELAELLARRVRARLVLVGRSEMPARDTWDDWLASHADDDGVSEKIRRLRRMEEQGGSVWLARADVADAAAMERVLAEARARWGSIHGVIHTAAAIDDDVFRFVEEAGQADCERQFRPKVRGLLVLEELLRDEPLDFAIACSSLAAVLGGFRFAAYSAGNLFQDAFAQQQSRASGVAWLSIGFDGWLFAGQTPAQANMGAELAEAAMKPDEGVEAFERILAANDAAHVLVSTSDLPTRIDKWIGLESLHEPERDARSETAAEHARPELLTPFVAPRSDLEQKIAACWAELLGIDRVGIDDNFFELGGHSLLGTQLISRLREELRVELGLRQLLDAPTVVDLGVAIVQLQAQQADDETLAAMLAELEGLSDEGVATALAEAEPPAAGGAPKGKADG